MIEVLSLVVVALCLFVFVLSRDVVKLRDFSETRAITQFENLRLILINAIERRLDDHTVRIEAWDAAYLRLETRVDDLDPEEVLAALDAKEIAFDRANTRIDNGIATARGLGQTAGESAARDLIRLCIERAGAGKGPPMQVLRDGPRTVLLDQKLSDALKKEES